MNAKQQIFRVRRNYNQWVNNQTLEDYALRFTAKQARRWSLLRVANTALGAISFLALEAIGGSMTLHYGFTNTVLALLAVGTLIFLTAIPICYYAAKYGVDIDLLTRGSGFGYIGSTFTSLIYASFTFIFFALEAAIMASAIHLLFGLPVFYGYIVSSVVIIPLVTHGITVISRFQLWTQPLWAVLQCLPFIFILYHDFTAVKDWTSFPGVQELSSSTENPTLENTFHLAAFGAVCAVMFSLMTQVGEQVDFLRFLPEKNHQNRWSWWLAMISAGPGWIVIGAIKILLGSLLAYLALRHFVSVNEAADPIQMYVVAFGYLMDSPQATLMLAGIFVILSQLKINVTNAYAGSLAWSNFFSRLTHSHPGRVVWLVFNVIIALVLMELGIYQTFEQTLGIYAIVAIGWLGALVADLTINKPLGLSPPYIEYRRAYLFDINPVGVGAMLLSSVLGMLCYMGMFGEPLQSLAHFFTLGLSLILVPLLALTTKSQYYIARKAQSPHAIELIPLERIERTTHHLNAPSHDQLHGLKEQCIICQIYYEYEDMAHCPAYGGSICSLCCSLDARCGDSCKPVKKIPDLLRNFLQALLPNSLVQHCNNRLIYFSLQLFFVSLITALMLSLVFDASATQDESFNALLTATLYKVFFILMIIAGVICWLFVLAHESRIVAQEESNRQTRLLREEIHAHEKTDQALQLAKEQAEAANQAKSRYLTGISHELRSPLNSLLGYAQLLEMDTKLPDTTRGPLSVIRRSGEHLADLIEGLLDVSKIEAGRLDIHREIINFKILLNQLVSMFTLQTENKGLFFIYDCQKTVPEFVYTDEKRLRQILINLLSNAVKFTEKGSIKFSVTYRNEVAVFTVRDSGIGIPEEDLERIFKPFERVRRPEMPVVNGTGLGLTITKLLIDILGGDISVKNNQNKGCTFSVSLMLSQHLPTPAQIKPSRHISGYQSNHSENTNLTVNSKSNKKNNRKKMVVVVDDDPNQSGLISDILSPLGFIVLEAPDAETCLDLYTSNDVDIFLLDVELPGLNGWQLVQILREQEIKTPIFMLSANAHETRQDSLPPHLISGYIVKPIRINTLLEKIGEPLDIIWKYHDRESSWLNHSQEDSVSLKTSPSILAQDHSTAPSIGHDIPDQQQISLMIQMAQIGHLRGLREELQRWKKHQEVAMPIIHQIQLFIEQIQLTSLVEYLERLSANDLDTAPLTITPPNTTHQNTAPHNDNSSQGSISSSSVQVETTTKKRS